MHREQRALESIILIRQILGDTVTIDKVLELARKERVQAPRAQGGREIRVS